MQKKKSTLVSQTHKSLILKLVQRKLSPLNWKYNKQSHKTKIAKVSKSKSLFLQKQPTKKEQNYKYGFFTNLQLKQSQLVKFNKEQNLSVLDSQKLKSQQKDLQILLNKKMVLNKQNQLQSYNSADNINFGFNFKNINKIIIDQKSHNQALQKDFIFLQQKKVLKNIKSEIQNKKSILTDYLIKKKQLQFKKQQKIINSKKQLNLKKQLKNSSHDLVSHRNISGWNSQNYNQNQNSFNRHTFDVSNNLQANQAPQKLALQNKLHSNVKKMANNEKQIKQSSKKLKKKRNTRHTVFFQRTNINDCNHRNSHTKQQQDMQLKRKRQENSQVLKEYAQLFRHDLRNHHKKQLSYSYQIVNHNQLNKFKSQQNKQNSQNKGKSVYRRVSQHFSYNEDYQKQNQNKLNRFKKQFQYTDKQTQIKQTQHHIEKDDDKNISHAKMRMRSNHKKIVYLTKSTKLFRIMGHTKYSYSQKK